MGIENRGHRNKLMAAIELLSPEDLFQEVPVGLAGQLLYKKIFQVSKLCKCKGVSQIQESEMQLEPCETSKMEGFVEIING